MHGQGSSASLNFVEYARLEIKNQKGETGTAISLEYAIKESKSETKIYWKVTNYSNSDLYDVDLGEAYFMISNGLSKKHSSFRLGGRVYAGDSKIYNKTVLSFADFSKYGKVKINSVKIEEPIISFKESKDGNSNPWSNYGVVKRE